MHEIYIWLLVFLLPRKKRQLGFELSFKTKADLSNIATFWLDPSLTSQS